jgi:hypothetical protein
MVAVAPRGGEARRQKRRLRGRTVGQDPLGVVQKNEKGEGSGSSKSQTAIEMKAVAIETIERTAEEFHSAGKTGQNWIWMR